jgi:hypothetical protein
MNTIKAVIELKHAHHYFIRDAEYVTRVYLNGELSNVFPGDEEPAVRKAAKILGYKVIIERPIRAGKLMFKTERFG